MEIVNEKAQNCKSQQKFEDRTTEITIEELKELNSFKDYSDEQAKNLIDTMKSFACIVYNLMAKENVSIVIDKTREICITEQLNEAA